MSERGNCKFFARGSCWKGEQCEYSHARKDPLVDVCRFYQKGLCAYGSRCRYKHIKASQEAHQFSESSSRNRNKSLASDSIVADTTRGTSSWVQNATKSSPSDKPARSLEHNWDSPVNGDVGESSTAIPSEYSFCTFPAANCPLEEKCNRIHGDQCRYCRKYCLHPNQHNEREKHLQTCEKKEKYLQALKDIQEIECNVCLERVLSKPRAAERKFGLFPECDHAFCISCIRNWRSSATNDPTHRMDLTRTVKACPVCRKQSYFVIPSPIWYSTQEEKQEIIENYKAKCKLIDCKHFDSGNGNCPFGTNCFYKHTVKPGSYTWIHHRPPPRRGNRFSKYNMLDMLSEFDLEGDEYYSIMRDSEFLSGMDPFELIPWSDMLSSGSGPGPFGPDNEDEDSDDGNIFRMAALSDALVDAGIDDDFDPEESDEEMNPMEAALISMMLSNVAEEMRNRADQ
ncbi:hypothetical protein L6164_023003 [Bauhinia variegata]|uniref:Uncharacterized protein n=1 Tax=Bauhinia variegata TaxID=167791 RepID=A0ACB9MHB7_BAUVA|nr:hypothetical protein L6164_023003 [Bauhinia variegata]